MLTSSLFRQGFLDFYKQGHFSDVTIVTARRQYRVHRMVLAFSSEFFEAMLLGEFKEKQTAVIDMKNMFDPRDIFPELLKIIYSGRVELTHAKVVPLLAISDVLLITSIHEKCIEYIAAHLNKSTALHFLLDAIELHQEPLAQQCIKMLASSFLHICDDTDFSGLDMDHFTQLICHPRLAVKDEWKLFHVILRYLQTFTTSAPSGGAETSNETSDREPSPPFFTPSTSSQLSDSEMVMSIMKNVRFFYLTYDQLLEVSTNALVPKSLLVKPLLARLQLHESPTSPLPNDFHVSRRLSCGIQFEVGDAENPHGCIHWLGTTEGTASWSNPAASGLVSVHASSVERGNPHSLVDIEPQELWTHDVPASWLSVDLGRFRVLPKAYMLRHGGNYKADSLRNWDFQGSVDGKTWAVLKRHYNDSSLAAPFAVKTFTLDKAAIVPYQWFRIIQTGHNSSNHNFLVLSGFEVYGELWEKDAWNSMP